MEGKALTGGGGRWFGGPVEGLMGWEVQCKQAGKRNHSPLDLPPQHQFLTQYACPMVTENWINITSVMGLNPGPHKLPIAELHCQLWKIVFESWDVAQRAET